MLLLVAMGAVTTRGVWKVHKMSGTFLLFELLSTISSTVNCRRHAERQAAAERDDFPAIPPLAVAPHYDGSFGAAYKVPVS